MKLSGNTVLITGGGSGIGFHLAKSFVDNGNSVIITGRNEIKLAAAARTLKNAEYAVCDVVDDDQIRSLAEQYGDRINVLINNAGVFHQFDYANGGTTIENQLKEIDIDFNGPVRMVHHFLPYLKKKPKAAIVNVSSGLAFVPLTVSPIYSATKAAMHSWTRSLRYQLQDTNIKIFELMPPLVETEMVEAFKGNRMMKPEKLSAAFINGFAKDKFEITPGQASQLKVMSRLAPNFIFNAVNKQFSE